MACTDSPENGPLIHLIDLNILTIQSTLDPPGGFFNIIQPDWQVLGGFDNRIYAFVSKSQDVIADLPPINEETETFILIYDVDQSEWSYIVDSAERTQYDPKNVGHRGSRWCDTGSNFRQNDLFSVESSLFPTKVDYRGYWLLRFLMEPYIKKTSVLNQYSTQGQSPQMRHPIRQIGSDIGLSLRIFTKGFNGSKIRDLSFSEPS